MSFTLDDGAGGLRALGSIASDAQGHLAGSLVVPGDVAPGSYALRGAWPGGAAPGTTIEVVPATAGREEAVQGDRDEDDPLLAALPSGWQRSDGRAAATAALAATARPIAPVLPLAADGIVGMLVAAALAVARRRG